MSTPYAIISIKGCLGEQCAGIEATDIKLALGEKRVITGAEKLSITFLDYDRTSNTGAFIVEKVLVSPVVCPEKCKCDADGKTIECWAEIVKCPEDTTLCPDGICRESCEITNITTECKFGCFYGNKCLPIGVRVKGKYCSIDGDLLPQLAEGVCDNNFECRTNLCINGECIAESLWQKIFNWIKGLFS